MPRLAKLLLLAAMSATAAGQILGGLHGWVSVLVACVAGALALWLAVSLWLDSRRSGR